jgi:ATP-dependent Clp protease ATP-binding subunit ClpA
VHKRFASAIATHIAAATPAPTFERFTDRARRVMAASSQAAISLGDNFVGTEHLLLGLFAEPDGIAGRALAAMDVSEDAVRAAIQAAGDRAPGAAEPSAAAGPSVLAGDAAPAGDAALAAAGATGPATGARPPFSGPAKRVLRDALAIALEFGHNYIGTEHLLLGLYRNGDSLAAQILTQAGASESTACAHVEDMLRGYRQGR